MSCLVLPLASEDAEQLETLQHGCSRGATVLSLAPETVYEELMCWLGCRLGLL